MAHCNHLFIQCMDFRFMKGIRAFLDERNLTGDCDLVSLAGAAKNIADPDDPSDRQCALKQIRLAHDLHHVTSLVLMNHLDCGAYGGAKAFATPEEERQKHVQDLESAKAHITAAYPDISVSLVIAKLDDGGNVQFEYLS